MRSLYTLNVTIHILAAFRCCDGSGSPELRSQLWRDLGDRFRRVGWACIVVLLATGMLNLWSTPYGRALAGTLTAAAAMVVVSTIHDFVLGPRASRLTPGSAEAATARLRSALIARVNALLAVAAVWAAVRLTRGG